MNKKIEFRAWNKEQKKMYDWNTLTSKKGIGIFTWIEAQNENLFKNNCLMQYIVLKDKNGKKIFEGDIIKTKEYYTRPYSENRKSKRFLIIVKYITTDRGLAEFSIENFDCGNYRYSDWNDFYDCEVVGNIYENPELLNKD